MRGDWGRLWVVAAGLLVPFVAAADGDDRPQRPKRVDPPAARAGEPDGRPQLTPELVARWKALSPEQRRRLKEIYRKRLSKRSPEELQRLRQLARRHGGGGERRRGEGRKGPPSFEKFAQRLLEHLPAAERAALDALAPDARRTKLRELVAAHRETVLAKQLERLPAEARQAVESAIEGKQGGQRFREAKRAMEGFVRERLQAVLTDPSLDDETRRAKAAELLGQFFPNARHRERLIQRFRGDADGEPPTMRGGRWGQGPSGRGGPPGDRPGPHGDLDARPGQPGDRPGPRGDRPGRGQGGERWRGGRGRLDGASGPRPQRRRPPGQAPEADPATSDVDPADPPQ